MSEARASSGIVSSNRSGVACSVEGRPLRSAPRRSSTRWIDSVECSDTMAKTYERLDPRLVDFIERQHVFFVATAPLAGDGIVNLSPKGLDTLRVLDERTVAYADLTGSGAETIAHLKENGRLTVMFCAFEGPPKIVRLQGQGEVLEPGHPEFQPMLASFPKILGIRAIIRLRATRISDSCGYAVPVFDYRGDRDALTQWTEKKGPEGLVDYRESHNRRSLDGLPALKRTPCAE